MIRKRETTIKAASAAVSAQLHPAARKRIRIFAETLEPGTARGGGRRENQCATEFGLLADLRDQLRSREADTHFAMKNINWLDGAMTDDRADRGVEMREYALRLAKRISIENAGAARGDIIAPPRVDGVISLVLWSPAIDRETERGLGDENIAAKRLKRRRDSVVRQLVVARATQTSPRRTTRICADPST